MPHLGFRWMHVGPSRGCRTVAGSGHGRRATSPREPEEHGGDFGGTSDDGRATGQYEHSEIQRVLSLRRERGEDGRSQVHRPSRHLAHFTSPRPSSARASTRRRGLRGSFHPRLPAPHVSEQAAIPEPPPPSSTLLKKNPTISLVCDVVESPHPRPYSRDPRHEATLLSNFLLETGNADTSTGVPGLVLHLHDIRFDQHAHGFYHIEAERASGTAATERKKLVYRPRYKEVTSGPPTDRCRTTARRSR